MEKSKTIIIYGEGGDGVRFLSKQLIFSINAVSPSTYITYFFDYDATIKHGNAVSYISIDEKEKQPKIAFKDCDLLLSFRENYPKGINAKKKILKIGFENSNQTFIEISLKVFRNRRYANMIAYAYILSSFEIPYELENLSDRNQEAVLLGDKLAKGIR